MKSLRRLIPFNNYQHLRHFLQWRWVYVAIVVGTILNMINQWDALIGRHSIDWVKGGMTYFVPYCVASVSAWYEKYRD